MYANIIKIIGVLKFFSPLQESLCILGLLKFKQNFNSFMSLEIATRVIISLTIFLFYFFPCFCFIEIFRLFLNIFYLYFPLIVHILLNFSI